MAMNIPIKIRSHHLLCMQGFQGYGYNDSFAVHLKGIIEQFEANPDMLIQVVDYCDEICKGCPHQMGHRCNKDDDADYRIKTMDIDILKCSGIHPDSVSTIREMKCQINNTFKKQEQLVAICRDCQWTKQCIWYLSLK